MDYGREGIWNLEGNLEGWEYEILKGKNMKSGRVGIWNLEGWEYEGGNQRGTPAPAPTATAAFTFKHSQFPFQSQTFRANIHIEKDVKKQQFCELR